MRTANTHKNMARCAATATLACVLGLGLAAPAYADTASDLAAARTKLEQIGTQTQQIYDELATQTQALDQTAGEITQKQQEIADGQAKLSTYVAGEYKTGGLSLLHLRGRTAFFLRRIGSLLRGLLNRSLGLFFFLKRIPCHALRLR